MDKTIETKFFEAFKWGGVVNKCIDWMRYTYSLPPMKPTDNENEQLQNDDKKTADETWERYYKEVLPKEILEATKAFDYSVIYNDDSPLINEIEANLNECQTDAQRERYLFSLLKPFGREPNGCGFARVFTPIAEVNQLNEQIGKYEKNKADWQTIPKDEQSIEQIGACDKVIKRLEKQIEWELHVNAQFCDLICGGGEMAKWMQENTVEHCLHTFVGVERIFANRLDALLLTYGINLLNLQKESGLYLKEQRLETDVINYIGSKELAQKYINALPQEPQLQQEINSKQTKATELEMKYFERAIEAGYMQKTETGYKWLWGGDRGKKARLSYFIRKIYADDCLQIPYKRLEKLFGISRLDSSISQLMNAKKEQKWQPEIDKFFQ